MQSSDSASLIASNDQIATGPFSDGRTQVKYGDPQRVAGSCRLAIVVSRFNQEITLALLKGSQLAVDNFKVPAEHLEVVWVPGAFELPVVARQLAKSNKYDAIVCLGAVIRGETGHYDFVAGQAAEGIARTATECGVPIILGVLTTDNFSQARERAGGTKGNKGYEAIESALEMVDVMGQIKEL